MELEDEPDEATKAALVAMILAGLGKAEQEIVATYAMPLFWRHNFGNGDYRYKGGTLFFLDTGSRVFGVTASHVFEACIEDTRQPTFDCCMLAVHGKRPIVFMPGDRIIDAHRDIDIATLDFTKSEIEYTGKIVLRGANTAWPPSMPKDGWPVTFCGFPGNGRRFLAPREITHGVVSLGGFVSNARDDSLSIQIEREHLMQVLGDQPMPENYDFGGISGGPALSIRQQTLRTWVAAGVIIQGPDTSGIENQFIAGLEVIRIRPIHFIKEDGFLDVERWEDAQSWQRRA